MVSLGKGDFCGMICKLAPASYKFKFKYICYVCISHGLVISGIFMILI